jgi:hypothetical protein
MRSLIVGIIAAVTFGCSGKAPPAQRSAVELPSIPAEVRPVNGSVVEYWPNGKTLSERVYASGQIRDAVYYASDGTVVFEMSEDRPKKLAAGK